MLIRLFWSSVVGIALSSASVVKAQCVATATLSGTQFSNNTSIGLFAWVNPAYAISSNTQRAAAGYTLGAFSSANSNYLFASGFGFSIPSFATVCGIRVTIEKRVTGLGVGSSVVDNAVYLLKGGSVVGSNQASASAWGASDATVAYGGNASLWGTTWSATDINSANFGIAISARLNTGVVGLLQTAEINYISLQVYYFTTALPVELVDFTATPGTDKVTLNWATASEHNSDYFSIQRQVVGDDRWVTIGTVAASGESQQRLSYQFIDATPARQAVYRIACVDIDKKTTYSPLVKTVLPVKTTGMQLTPNPASDQVRIQTDQPFQKLLLINSEGRVCLSATPAQASLSYTLQLNKLPSGIYAVQLQRGAETETQLLLIRR